jgi:uncharacterized protein (TIGR02757 family)
MATANNYKKENRTKLSLAQLKSFLDEKVVAFNQPGFIEHDPVCIPHRFAKKQDIEIAALFAAVLAWGQRKTIINKCTQLLTWMDNDPYAFVCSYTARDLKPFAQFKHRTFNGTDTVYFLHFLQAHYRQHASLEPLFTVAPAAESIENGLIHFHDSFFSLPDYPARTKKHIATPARKSTCKRMAMYLRWMVRHDRQGVDFGLWKTIKPSQLVCPCDVHVERVARKLKLIKRKPTDWQTALELTRSLKKLDADDPVKYDFALFGLGVEEGWR